MDKQKTFSDNVLEFNESLANIALELFDNYTISNPFSGKNRVQIKEITNAFYKKYYNDHNKRYLILGSSPARKGTATTGIPYEDASHLYKETGIMIDNFYINKSSSDFLYDVMEQYGGCEKFYKNFFMSFVCSLGIVNVNSKGNEVNSNYYENKKLENALYNFIVDSLKNRLLLELKHLYVIVQEVEKILNFKKKLMNNINFLIRLLLQNIQDLLCSIIQKIRINTQINTLML